MRTKKNEAVQKGVGEERQKRKKKRQQRRTRRKKINKRRMFRKRQRRRRRRQSRIRVVVGCHYLRQPGDVQAFSMLHCRLAGLPRPRPLALTVSQAGPGEDVVVGQIQVSWVHCKLADEFQQTGQAIQQPLQDEDAGGLKR